MEIGDPTAAEAALTKKCETIIMKSGKLDMSIMLWSTDWFLPYWFTLGIGIGRDEKAVFQQGCREITKQIMSGASEYSNTTFSDERIAATRSTLKTLLTKSNASRSTVDKINALIGEGELTRNDEVTGWLVLSITEQFFQNSLANDLQLESEIKEALTKVWNITNQFDHAQIDFEQLCLNSNSDWDIFTRSVTPELPTRLADYLSTIRSEDKFGVLWAAIDANLSNSQRCKLLNWYRSVGKSMTGEPLRLPAEA